MKIKIKCGILVMLCVSLLIIALACKTKSEQEKSIMAKEPVASFPKTSNYEELIALFKEWREFLKPSIVDGYPDFSEAAIKRQWEGLQIMKARPVFSFY